MQLPIDTVKQTFLTIRDQICDMVLLFEDDASFLKDQWVRPQGGGGESRVLYGQTFEQAGVNFSHITGDEMPGSATAHRPELAGRKFEALGVSVVLHPRNPYVPTTHFNFRLFVASKANADPIWWFGGGFDLTPFYGFEEDCQHFHQVAKKACDQHGSDLYNRFKNWADEYFYLKHRGEARGIGGIFFDDFNELPFDEAFAFTADVGRAFIEAYTPIVDRRKDTPYTETERDFQLYRRGRYVEFNLIYDRGTLFGLQSGGRTESILMSLPKEVRWQYNWSPTAGSAESALYEKFLPVREWA